VALRLDIAIGTVNGAVHSAMDKLNADTRRQAAMLARPTVVAQGPDPGTRPTRRLQIDQQRLLSLMAQGRSVTEAAAIVHVSRRTAHRRLECARSILGVVSTAEAIHASFPG
jgi:DNA-binding CsgD family transcriptional regulator